MGDLGAGVFFQEGIHPIPVSFVVANLVAPRADGQQSAQLTHFPQRRLQLGVRFLKRPALTGDLVQRFGVEIDHGLRD